jgi:DNA-directed RNA polymerase subunit RPC12/RpoP
MQVRCSSCGKKCNVSPVKYEKRHVSKPFKCFECNHRSHGTVVPDGSAQRTIKDLAWFKEEFF